MKIAQILGITLLVCIAPSLHAAPLPIFHAAVEARVAAELSRVDTELGAGKPDYDADYRHMRLALALAHLGRSDASLRTARQITIDAADVSNGRPRVMDEVRRVAVRRRCLSGNRSGAAELIPTITSPLIRADALLIVARAALRDGDTTAAAKSLLQVSPLVPDRYDALAYTAYLLTRSGEPAAARRLFDRAIAKLPSPGKPVPADPENWDREYRRDMVERFLRKACYQDEADKLYPAEKRMFGMTQFQELIDSGQYDEVLKRSRSENPLNQMGILIWLAIEWDKRKGDHAGALKIMDDAEGLYRTLPEEVLQSLNRKGPAGVGRGQVLLMLAFGRRSLGDEAAAQKWEAEAVRELPPGQVAQYRSMFVLMPVILQRTAATPVAAARLAAIDAELDKYLPAIEDAREGLNLLRWLVEAQIKAGQMEAAQKRLAWMERWALKLLPAARDNNDLWPIFDVARKWRETGDLPRAQALLDKLFKMRLHKNISQRDRAQMLIVHGFIDEGKARLAKLPVTKNDKKYSPSPAYWEAHFRPEQFPEWIAEIKSPRERLETLIEFTRALSEPVTNVPDEREYTMPGLSGQWW